MNDEEVLEVYKKHECQTRQDIAALLTIAEMLGCIHEAIDDLKFDVSYELNKIRTALEARP